MPKRALVGGAGLFAASHHAVTTRSQAAVSGLDPSHIRMLKSQQVLIEPCCGVLVFAGLRQSCEQRLRWALRRAAVFGFSALAACQHGSTTAKSSGSSVSPASDGRVLPANAVMARDVDGDTIDVTIAGKAERIRLVGIDTPETKKPNTPIQCYGELASAHTKSLLPIGTPLYLERDVVPRDDYGRLLAYVYRADDGLFVNLEIIANGYARVLSIPPNIAHRTDFVAAATAAEAHDIGLWKSCK